MCLAGRYSVVLLVGPGCSVVVWRAFRVFVIKHTVGMHAVGARGIVLEDYLDRVADFRAENRSQNAGSGPLGGARLQLRKSGVGIFPVKGFAVNRADPMRAAFNEHLR